MAMKEYEVTFTLKVTEVVEAESKEDAEQAFSELWDDPSSLLEYGSYKVTKAK